MTTERVDIAALAAALSYSIERITRLERAMQAMQSVAVDGLQQMRDDLTGQLRQHGRELGEIRQGLGHLGQLLDPDQRETLQ